jgi:phosphopantothenoylcysteine synthetase/decarboxylase
VNSKASNHFTQSPTTNNEFDRVKEERKTVGKKKKETEQQSNLLEPPSIVAKNLRTSGSHADHRTPLSRLVSLSLTGGSHSFSLARRRRTLVLFCSFFFYRSES